ncbi:AMP-dependent synthetase [Paracoccus versutus]|uniref:Acyl-CoA synthetase (AMP-forming)/AMP-acid ligase II n=1 Tax=Paracoccus versutus TaxID=34007 RepID=A0AAQ0KLS7_PARVE|nr:AMP-binding protein [Paracoccus versutus]KGJ08265.1 AMP-dependent synthetase [Paracoccus versutus]REG46876.1 acyl-CoA synthetase (AMP-forming)/AMP-acid ligase II [Paracoccus versutus]WEJ79104.1 AMP-dependent synthetase [Paracoccus versutus]
MRLDPLNPPQGTTRDWLDHRAADQGRTISHVFPEDGSVLTWRELRDEAARIAGHLAGLGLERGESVALMMPNGRNAVLGLYGALYGGFRATMINLIAGADAIGYVLSHSGARALLVDPGQRALLEAALAAHPAAPVVIEAGAGFDWPAGCAPAEPHPHGAADDALLMYTSGTTGRPKGVVHSHASLLAGGWTTALAHELRPEDRALCVLPIYHINGLCVTILGPLLSGGSVVVCDRFSASRFWGLCDRHEASWFSVVPTIISHLLHGEGEPSPAARARLRFGRSASAALAPEVQSSFERRFGIPIIETMGLTETAAQILSNPLPPGLRKIGSPGRAVGNQVAILSPDLRPLPPGIEGEIAVRGANVMRGYLGDPAATAAALTPDGWLRTGDLGQMDEEGYVFVTGRLKELIIKGGENIAPREIDEALYTHPDVIEAAAFARQCARYGERVEAAVTLRPGSPLGAPELISICEERLGKFKSPEVIHLMAELPKGPSGKIQRLKLAQLTQ